MKLRIEHLTRHRYSGPVSFSDHKLYLRPLDGHLRRVQSFTVETIPPSTQRYVRDVDNNTLLVCNFGLRESDVLEFKTVIEVDLAENNPYDFILAPYATEFPFDYTDSDTKALMPYMSSTVAQGASQVADYIHNAHSSPRKHHDVVQYLGELNQAIRRDISYVRRDEEGIQSPDNTLQLRSGSCRDMAVLFIAAVRQIGLAARFVSGYLYDPPSEDGLDHTFNRAVGSMHAWAEVYLPGAGWKGFDPTNGILANSYFIPTGVSHAPEVVDPIQGSYFSKQLTQSELDIELHIQERGLATLK